MSRSSPWADDSAQLGKMKIVIIDDEPVNVALLEEILVENEYTRFESVVDSKLALEVCKNFQPDLVLLDLMMPPPDGFAILESLRADASEMFLPVVVLTADTNEESKRRALDAGATDFLLKPFDHIEVALRIRNLLKSRRAHLLLDNQRAALEDAIRERTVELRSTIAELQKTNELLADSV
ncbi:MAG TPA: response regulator [Chthoniobacterales bacterium]|jgi:putative two-component system response regulator|nr:response regulator [Chthoniobacterales bacterium]